MRWVRRSSRAPVSRSLPNTSAHMGLRPASSVISPWLSIGIDDLLKPVHIKDEGGLFSVWAKGEKIDIPSRFLSRFRKFLRQNGVEFEDQFGGRTFVEPEE